MLTRAFTATLALLGGAVLVWVLAGGSGEERDMRVKSPQEKRSVRLERRLAGDTANRALLVATMRSWLVAGAERLSAIDTKSRPIPSAVVEDYEAGLRVWERYLRLARGAVDAEAAATAGTAYFELVEIGSPDPDRVARYAAGAARAQGIVGRRDPSSFTLNRLAAYRYFNGEYAAGDRAAKRALRYVDGATRGIYSRLMRGHRERGERFVARVERARQTLDDDDETRLATPIKGYGTPAGINGDEPRPAQLEPRL